jgi:hypothetical protein
VTIDWAHTSALLGADMLFNSDNHHGWGAIVTAVGKTTFTKADFVKIPHHGSITGHDPRMWSDLLSKLPLSVIAPYGRGPRLKRPPKSSDINRIKKLSSRLYQTARHIDGKTSTKDAAVKRSLRDGGIRLTPKFPGFGMVRFRCLPGKPWRSERFGSAIQIK